ncbi:MAG: hypothetical protein ACOC6B_07095 [Thermodesulfobacteriota bacterium]
MKPSYPECDADDVTLPAGYLEWEITRNLRAGLGEELWEALVLREKLDKLADQLSYIPMELEGRNEKLGKDRIKKVGSKRLYL